MKISDKELEYIKYSTLDESTKVNLHLDKIFEEQSRSQNKQFITNLIFVILTFIVAIITLIVTILK